MAENGDLPLVPGEPLNVQPVERAMLAMCYGVHVIGSRAADGTHNVMLADWVMQVSFKPRLIAASIENDARTLRFIKETGVFSVNLLHQKDGAEIARRVVMPAEGRKIRGRSAEASAVVHNKLEGLAHTFSPEGCPLLRDALGWMTCEVRQHVETGDHTLVIAEVLDGAVQRSGDMLTEQDLGWEYAG